MANFRDPAIILRDFLVIVKFWHIICGLYFWEFFTTLDYEWSVIRGRRPYRWTIWIYSLTRVATLIAIILIIVGIDINNPDACQVLITSHLVFAYMAIAAASILIVLRIVAIWNRQTVIMAIAIGVWATNVSFLFLGIVRLRASWLPAQATCSLHNVQSMKPMVIANPVCDVILLLIMLVGLLRLRLHGGAMLHLGHLLWKQGIIWLLLATVGGVPPAVFISLNLNDMLTIMFQLPALVTMSIAATRMYRLLTDFVFESTDFVQDSLQGSGPPVPRAMQTHVVQIPLNQTEVAVDMSYLQYPTSQTISMDGQGNHKPNELASDEDLERGVEN